MKPRALIVDVDSDPPLGGAERVVASVDPETVLRGLGREALEHPRAALAAECADAGVAERLREAAARLGAAVEVRDRRSASRDVLRLRPTQLAEAEWLRRGVGGCAIAVAGAVAEPRVFLARPESTVGDLVAAAVPKGRAWAAMFGGAFGRIVDRDEAIGSLVDDERAARLILVLPVGHALVRRARQPLSTWLKRAQSACASCAICAPACPEGIAVPELLRIVSVGKRARATARLAAATACTACGACDLVCPQALSPARITDDLGHRLRQGGVRVPVLRARPSARLDASTAASRLGLGRYTRPLPVELRAL